MVFPENSSFLITGGTGSFGRRFVAELLRNHRPRQVIIFSRDEQKHVAMMRGEFCPRTHPSLRYVVGDVRDYRALRRAMAGVDYVVHAAAMKHVDIAEMCPGECIATNVGGAEHVIEAARDVGVKRVIGLSTDKAASPVSAYGASKLCADKLFAATAGDASGPTFAVVRYGNVFGSAGSVAPYFLRQRSTGVLTVTDRRMTRFIITLDQCVQFVLLAFQRMHGGEIFVPKIPSARIIDLAEAAGPACRIEIVGVRPGEKMHECMIPADDAYRTREFSDCYVIDPPARQSSATIAVAGTPCPSGFSYTSDNNEHWLTRPTLQAMLATLDPEAQVTFRAA